MNELTATQSRLRRMEIAMRYDLLANADELSQMAAIAHHYRSQFAYAQQVTKILELSRGAPMTEAATSAARYMIQQIKNNHAHDLGLELAWSPLTHSP